MLLGGCVLACLGGPVAHAADGGDPPPAAPVNVADDFAQLSLEDLLSLATVTVSGGTSESRATAAGNVIVVTRLMIAQNGWRSVADVLANTPGLYLIDDGSLISVGIRGVTGGLRAGTRLIKIMINGIPVNFRPDVRAFIGPEYIPIEAVERIEIVKGPLSALYGAEAFLATVNVITRQPENGTTVDISANAISQNGAHFGAGAASAILYGDQHVRLLLSATNYNIDRSGLSVQRTFDAQDPTTDRYRPFFAGPSRDDITSPAGAYGQLSYRGDRLGTLTLDAGLQRLDANAEFQLNSALTHQSRESIRNVWVNVTHEKSWSAFKTHATLGGGTGEPTRDDQLYLTDNFTRVYRRNFDYHSVMGSFAGTYAPSPRFSLRVGVDAEVQRQAVLYFTQVFHDVEGMRMPGDSVDLIGPDIAREQNMSDVGAHAQVVTAPFARLPDLQISGNVRVDRVMYGSFNPAPQISARLALVDTWRPGVVLKLIAGRAFQAPSGVLMFAEPGFGATNNVIGNLTSFSTATTPLRPQTVSSVEGVAYLLLGEYLSLDVAAFYQRISDRIEFQTAGSDYVAHNAGDVSYAGGEASLRASVRVVVPFLDVSYVRPITSSSQSDANPLTAYPSLAGSAGLDTELPRLPMHLNLRARYVGERPATFANTLYNASQAYKLPALITVDGTLLTSDFHLLGPRVATRFSFSARNILDRRYSEPGFGGFDVPMQGRTLMFGLQQWL